jgi:4-aminobutyrate aminotransferase
MRRPSVQSRLPGPKAKAIIERVGGHRSLPGGPDYALVVDKAEGCWVVDADGNELLDMTAAGGICPLGHGHPQIVEAIREQAGTLIHHAPWHAHSTLQAQLTERLCSLGAVRGKDQRAYLCTSGSEALRAALELARHHTERDSVIAFVQSFEGPDLSAVPVTTSKVIERSGLKSLVSGVFHASFPDPLRQGDEATIEALEHIGMILGKLVAPGNVAALLIEPIQHEGGYLVPPDQFLVALRRLCDQHDMLLIANEIQTSLGRTGSRFGWQHSGVEPDLVCMAAGLAGGLPLGAVIARKELAAWPPGVLSGTFSGNPVACAAALKTLELINGAQIDAAAKLGDTLRDKLVETVGGHPQVAEVRGRGLLLAVEFVKDRDELERDPELRDDVVDECFQRGLLLGRCGASSVAFSPALTVNSDEVEVAVEIFAKVLGDIN